MQPGGGEVRDICESVYWRWCPIVSWLINSVLSIVMAAWFSNQVSCCKFYCLQRYCLYCKFVLHDSIQLAPIAQDAGSSRGQCLWKTQYSELCKIGATKIGLGDRRQVGWLAAYKLMSCEAFIILRNCKACGDGIWQGCWSTFTVFRASCIESVLGFCISTRSVLMPQPLKASRFV